MDQNSPFDFRIKDSRMKNKKPLPPRGTKRLTPEQAYKRVMERNWRVIEYLKDK